MRAEPAVTGTAKPSCRFTRDSPDAVVAMRPAARALAVAGFAELTKYSVDAVSLALTELSS